MFRIVVLGFGATGGVVNAAWLMRLLLINNAAKYVNGGANRVVVETLEGLHRRGVTVGCVYHSYDATVQPGIWTRKVAGYRPREEMTRELLSAIEDFQPDVIQCHSAEMLATYRDWVPRYAVSQFVHDQSWYCSGGNRVSRNLTPCRRPHGISCLMWHVVDGCNGRNPWGNYLRWMQTRRQAVLHAFPHLRIQVASRFMARGFLENRYPPERIDVIPLYSGPPGATGAVEPGLVVLPSRLVFHKGVHVLIEALSLLRDVRWRLVVPGDGPERPALLEQARRLGVAERVELPGELHPDAVAHWYARAQVVAFPVLREEPFGLVGTEALSYGKPIVAFAGGAVEEWLWPGETGLQVETKTAAAFSVALGELLRNPDRCTAMGAAARRRHARFTLDAYLGRLLESLERTRAAGPIAHR